MGRLAPWSPRHRAAGTLEPGQLSQKGSVPCIQRTQEETLSLYIYLEPCPFSVGLTQSGSLFPSKPTPSEDLS